MIGGCDQQLDWLGEKKREYKGTTIKFNKGESWSRALEHLQRMKLMIKLSKFDY